jgi:hypothetical protein
MENKTRNIIMALRLFYYKLKVFHVIEKIGYSFPGNPGVGFDLFAGQF